MLKIGDYNTITSDRNIFNQIVYTPLSEALRLLDERRKDPVLMAKVDKFLKGNVPDIFKNNKCGILSRHIATPNNESRRFISIAKESGLYPVFFEYHDDKFVPKNDFKYSLGKLTLNHGVGKNGGQKNEFFNIIDFNTSNGKKIRDIKTLWSEPLVDFHKKLFTVLDYKNTDVLLYDASGWFKDNGGKAVDYYTNLLLMFTCYGILFENFLISKSTEGDFTKEIVLPSIEKVMNLVGVKPLIVPLEPLDLETEDFWLNHLSKIRESIPNHKYHRHD